MKFIMIDCQEIATFFRNEDEQLHEHQHLLAPFEHREHQDQFRFFSPCSPFKKKKSQTK